LEIAGFKKFNHLLMLGFWREGRMGIGKLNKMGGIFCEEGEVFLMEMDGRIFMMRILKGNNQ
jgi:hypothetical protein